jgi:hypothetical protein
MMPRPKRILTGKRSWKQSIAGSCAMSVDHRALDRTVRMQQDANEQEFRRLQDLSLEERGWMLHAACQAAAQMVASRRAAGLPEPLPAPWPASTREFFERHAAHVQR